MEYKEDGQPRFSFGDTVEINEMLVIVPGSLKQKVRPTREAGFAEKYIKTKAVDAVKIDMDDYEVVSKSQIDLEQVRITCFESLGPELVAKAVLIFNTYGFSGKAEASLVYIDKKDKNRKETDIYQEIKGVITSGRISMKAGEVTVARMVRAYSDMSADYFGKLKTPGPFGLSTQNRFCWWYGGIYSCHSTMDQLGHFFGMHFAMMCKKPVAKKLAYDFPTGYVRRTVPSQVLLAQTIILFEFIDNGENTVESLTEALTSFFNATDMSADEYEELFDNYSNPIGISYLMSLGQKWFMMLPATSRAKFNKTLVSEATRDSVFVKENITAAEKQSESDSKDKEVVKASKKKNKIKTKTTKVKAVDVLTPSNP